MFQVCAFYMGLSSAQFAKFALPNEPFRSKFLESCEVAVVSVMGG
jgi:hypothetical protein